MSLKKYNKIADTENQKSKHLAKEYKKKNRTTLQKTTTPITKL